MLKLSVIIPTRNRSYLLRETLISITKQSFSKDEFEVIVIDNGSTDNTRTVVESFCDDIKYLVYYYDETPGLHVGRHDGYKLSKSDILVYADDDIEAFPMWLETIYHEFQDDSVVLVGGKILPKYEVKPPFWVLEKWYDLCEYGHCVYELSLIDFGDERKEVLPYYVFGCNYSVRKRVIMDAGGFHPDGMPFELIEYRGDGETYLSHYISQHGLKTIYNPQASVYHKVPKERMTIDYFCQRSFRAGIERSYKKIRYQSTEVKSNTILRWKYKLKKWTEIILGIEAVRLLSDVISRIGKTDMERQIIKAEHIGYRYHQEKYKVDKKLQNWVHKETYME